MSNFAPTILRSSDQSALAFTLSKDANRLSAFPMLPSILNDVTPDVQGILSRIGWPAAMPVQRSNPSSAEAIKNILDQENGEYTFEYRGEKYSVKNNKETQKYQCVNAFGEVVDEDVRIGANWAVDGFVEVGGLKGLNQGERLYIGEDPENAGKLVCIVATAELDKNDGYTAETGREALFRLGRRVHNGEAYNPWPDGRGPQSDMEYNPWPDGRGPKSNTDYQPWPDGKGPKSLSDYHPWATSDELTSEI